MTRPKMTRSTGRPSDSGFTLVEVLVAIVIEAIIVGALGMAFIGIMKTTTSTNQSLSRSGDARIAAAYIISDARNSSGPEVSLTTSTCSDPSPPVAGSLIVQFGWNTTAALTGASTSNAVDYYLGSNKLMRRECQNNVLVSDRVVASNVASVAIACSPTANCTGAPTSVTATITETADASGNQYVYSLTGAFRKLIGGGIPATPSSPQSVILLGSGSTCVSGATGLSMSTSAHITVYGTAVINNTDSGSCTAMNMTTSSSFQAGQTKILAGGTCNDTTSAVCPTTTSYSPAITDPFGTVTAPVAATLGLTNQTDNTCSTGIGTPGVYTSTFSVTTSHSCDLQPGVYILTNGISITTSAHLTSSAGGVLLYITGGSFQSSTSATINISAQTTNAWAGIAIWQAKTDTNTMSFSTSGSVTIGGFIYAAGAAVNMSTSASNPTVKGIIAKNIIMTTSANLVIGDPPTVVTTSLANGEQGVAYSATMSGSGGNTPYTWSATGLPSPLVINASSGVISGTPSATGTSSVTVKLTEATGAFDTQAMSLAIVAVPAISTASLPQGEKTAPYSTTLTPTGGVAPYSWSAPSLPAGLTMSSAGVISGTPTGTVGTTAVTAMLSDALGGTASKALSIAVIAAPTITTASLPSATYGVAYSTTVAGSGGTTPYSWSATGLPTGLTMSTAGVISGTPTSGLTATVAITLTDNVSGTATASLALVVKPTIVSVALGNKLTAPVGTTGTIEQGDTITIVYSSTMKVSTFCNTWSNDANNQALNADSLVTVNVSAPASGNDVLSVSTASGCAFNLTSINLGSGAYTSGTTAAAFNGSGTNKSTITWTAATKTLVITLGAKTAGTIVNVATSTPVYTAAPGIQDSTGTSLNNYTFALPAGKQF